MSTKSKNYTSIVPKNIVKKPAFPKPKAANNESEANLGFPLAQYTSIVGTKSVLLLFTALFLPRSSTWVFGPRFLEERRMMKTSLDRPEHPFMVELTDWPEVTMAWVCLGVALVTAWWAGYVKEWRKTELKHFEALYGEKKKGNQPPTLAPPTKNSTTQKLEGMKEAVIATLCGVPFIYIIVVFFGAPINSHFTSTALLSVLLATLLVYTPIYAIGAPSLLGSDANDVLSRMTFVRLFSEFSPRSPLENGLVYPALGCVFGCGIGAFTIPLDWDRPWQAWPLTPAFGAITGYILGSVYSVVKAGVSSATDMNHKSQ